MVTDGNQTYGGDHFQMCRNTKSLCCVTGTTIMLYINYTLKSTKQTNSQKKIRFLVTSGGGLGEGELDEGVQKVQTSSYKINKYQGCNIQHDKNN